MMETNIEELVRQYEALWENDAPMEQIVEFCRQLLKPDADTPLIRILHNSRKWGELVLMPPFLKHLRDDDAPLLCTLANYLLPPPPGGYGYRHINHSKVFAHVSRVLSMRTVLSDRTRAFFWRLMISVSWPYFGLIPNGIEDIVLVDNADVRTAIVKRKRPGWELIPKGLVFWEGRRQPLTDKMQQAIARDSVPMFELAMTLSGKTITAGLLREILHWQAFNITSHLLRKRPKAIAAILTPRNLLICLLLSKAREHPQVEKAIACLDTLEELSPGVSKSTDSLGNTPLWYCLYHRSPSDELVQALIRHGCDPDQRNHLNLSYRICAEAQKLT